MPIQHNNTSERTFIPGARRPAARYITARVLVTNTYKRVAMVSVKHGPIASPTTMQEPIDVLITPSLQQLAKLPPT